MSIDSATSAKMALLYPDFRVRCVRVLEDMQRITGRPMRLLEGIRSFESQAADYAQGRSTPGKIITNAKPGYSYHAYGVGGDFVFIGDDPYLEKMAKTDPRGADELWETYAKTGEAHGLHAGRRFPRVDSDHLEAHYGTIRIQDMLSLYEQGGIRAVWSSFDKARGVPVGTDWDQVTRQSRLVSLLEKPGNAGKTATVQV